MPKNSVGFAPLYLVSNTTLEPQLENTHETPQSSRDEGLLLLYGLESNPESSLQTPQEAQSALHRLWLTH